MPEYLKTTENCEPFYQNGLIRRVVRTIYAFSDNKNFNIVLCKLDLNYSALVFGACLVTEIKVTKTAGDIGHWVKINESLSCKFVHLVNSVTK